MLLLLALPAYAIDGAFDCTEWSSPADVWPTAYAMDLDASEYGYRAATGVYTVPFTDVLTLLYAFSEPGCPYLNDGGDLLDVSYQSASDDCYTAAGDHLEWYRRTEPGFDTHEQLGTWTVTVTPASGALTSLTFTSTATGATEVTHEGSRTFNIDTWAWEASWTGHLGDDYPDDGWMALTARPESTSDYLDGSWTDALDLHWSSPSCDWALDYAQAYDVYLHTEYRFTQAEQTLVVYGEEADTCGEESATATLDGVAGTVAVDGWTPLTDRDGDGYCAEIDDCRDVSVRFHPGARDLPYDGLDQDCDGADLVDVDRDGYTAVEAGGDDCDDRRAGINPGAVDRFRDGFDQNCNGVDGR